MQKVKKLPISIVISSKNEGEGIGKILISVKSYSDDIIVVDGHSTDNTKQVTEKHKARFFLDHGKGKGDAMKVGVAQAKHNVIIFFDADGSHDSSDIPVMANLLISNKGDLVIGSRRTGGSFDIQMSFSGIIRSAGCDFLVMLINKKFNSQLTDVLYSFRGVKKHVFNKLNLMEDGFGIEQEMVVSCLKHNYKVVEIPSREHSRGWGTSKLHTITGLQFLFSILKEFI